MITVVFIFNFIKIIFNNYSIIILFIVQFLFYGCESATYENNKYSNQKLKANNEIIINSEKNFIKEIKIGLLLPLSGSNSNIGNSLLKASQLSLNKTKNKNIQLIIKDTENINKNIITSYYELINEDVDIILGPLFTKNIELINSISLDEDTIMITFSNNTEIKNKNTFISGLTPEDEIKEVFKYAIESGKKKFGVILPNNQYGLRSKRLIESLLAEDQVQLTEVILYDSKNPDFYEAAKVIANYEIRKYELEKKLEELKNLNSEESKRKYKLLKNKDTLGSLNFDSIFIGAENIKHLSMLASILPYYDVDPKEVLYIGNSLWSNNIALKEPALEKGLFPNVNQANYENFKLEYINAFKKNPHKISSLAYDLIGLISTLQKNNQNIDVLSVTNENGFMGSNGLFRFKRDGNIERSLSIFQIKNQKIKEVQKANSDFN
ncbi:penicillin-binding protein activator [Pelagibacteraceae bacterium]|nr:penicillin-binding protein activator [Pelagibacteraceae bacterium]